MGDIKTLDFHHKIAREAISEDGVLTIMAPGLGMTAVLGVMIEHFLSSGSSSSGASQGMYAADREEERRVL